MAGDDTQGRAMGKRMGKRMGERMAELVPPEAWIESLNVRSYEAGRDGSVRAGVILRYLEELATRASAGLGFDNAWYREHGGAWVVREMALGLNARAAIADELRLATWVSAFRRVQATREYLIVRADNEQIVAWARARWAYIDRATGQLTRIPEALIQRMGPWGDGMRPLPLVSSTDGLTPDASLALVAREYEADSQGHINNCVYMDWFEEAARQALPKPMRLSYVKLEYIRPALPGDALTVHTAPAAVPLRSGALWQWITPSGPDASDAAPIARAWSEWMMASDSAPPSDSSTAGAGV